MPRRAMRDRRVEINNNFGATRPGVLDNGRMFRDLNSLSAWQAAIAQSAQRPAVIFKHSLTCGTSAMAMEEIQALTSRADVDADISIVRIQEAREVSRAIEQQLGVRHESPQVLLVVDGRVVWHASHFRVTASGVRAALQPYTTAAASHPD